MSLVNLSLAACTITSKHIHRVAVT